LIEHAFLASHLSRSNAICYVLADILVELTVRAPDLMLQHWTAFQALVNGLVNMPPAVANVVVRAILPIINNRTQLSSQLLDILRKNMLNPLKVESALPILLLLFKSVTANKSVQRLHSSQSFATFSSQALCNMGMQRNSDERVALEIFGIIRRCINQSAQTKILIYEVSVKNSELSIFLVLGLGRYLQEDSFLRATMLESNNWPRFRGVRPATKSEQFPKRWINIKMANCTSFQDCQHSIAYPVLTRVRNPKYNPKYPEPIIRNRGPHETIDRFIEV
jgi:hypothetical protein